MTAARPTSRFFRARVTAIADLTPSFRRFTFGGPDLADYGERCGMRYRVEEHHGGWLVIDVR